MAIDLNFDEQQEMVRDTARQFFAQHSPIAVVRRHRNGEDEFPQDLWRRMAELGWLAMGLPEAHGGFESSFLDSFALAQELGRSLAPVPYLETWIGAQLVAELGSEAQKAALLPPLAEGQLILTPAVMEADGLYGPEGVTLVARPDGGGFVLDGAKTLVAYAGSAARLIVAARTAADGITLFLVDPKSPGVSLERTPNTAGLPLYAVVFKGAKAGPDDVLGPVGGGWPALNETQMKAAVLQSAMVQGAGERILDFTIDYARTRVQFGEQIGKHQAVQYLITDIAIHAHNTGLLALQAAWRIAEGQPFLRQAAFAKAAAGRAAHAMTFASHEVHAGIGFMEDYDLQLFTRRGKHWEFNLGDPRWCLEQTQAA
ncbi:MAG: acyl-CoA dehydrogenase protein [Phenylobacterium sp.]|nr:acyl-CoA dehydrogenase protein [Phenylobacterium sp.]